MYEEKESSWSFAIGLFVGAAAGAALGGLFTPRSGAQNREIVRERGLVLKDRVSDRATTVSTSVKDTTNSTVSSVKETTNAAVTTVKGTANNAVTTVKDTTNSAVSNVKEAKNTAVAKVSDTVATVKESVATAAEKVSGTASSVVGKVSDTASSAVEKARSMTGQTQEVEIPLPSSAILASEARYDAEDVRPVSITGTDTLESAIPTAPPAPESLDTLASIETFEPTMPAVTPLSDEQIDRVISTDVLIEVSSDEQFEVADMTGESLQERTAHQPLTGSGSSDVREASEGSARGDRPTNS